MLEEVPVQLPRREQPDVVQNGRDAKINGIETDINYVAGGLTLNAAAAYTDAKTKGNICRRQSIPTTRDCSATPATTSSDADRARGCRSRRSSRRTATARYSWPIWTGKAHVQGERRLSRLGARPTFARSRPAASIRTTISGEIRASTLVDLFAGYDWEQVQRRAVRQQRVRRTQRTVAFRRLQHLHTDLYRAGPAADDRHSAGVKF